MNWAGESYSPACRKLKSNELDAISSHHNSLRRDSEEDIISIQAHQEEETSNELKESEENVEINLYSEKEYEFAEGGIAAWTVVFGSFLMVTVTFGFINSIGVIQLYVSENQLKDKSEQQIGWLFSLCLFFCFLGGVQVGPIFDAYGPRYLNIIGSILFFFFMMMCSLCKEYYQFILCYGVGLGIACALIVTPAIATIGHWFLRRRSTATGYCFVGGSLGGVVFPLLLRKLFAVVSYGWAIRVLAFICLGCLILGTILVRSPMQKSKVKFKVLDTTAFKDLRFDCLSMALFCSEFSMFVVITFLSSYSSAQGFPEEWSYYSITILNATSIFGRVITGYMADRMGAYNIMTSFCILTSLCIWVIWLPFGHHLPVLIVFSVLYGFCTGCLLCLAPVCAGKLSSVTDYGKRYGTCYCFVSLGILISIPSSATLISDHNYTNLIYLCGSLSLVGAALCATTRFLSVGLSLKKNY